MARNWLRAEEDEFSVVLGRRNFRCKGPVLRRSSLELLVGWWECEVGVKHKKWGRERCEQGLQGRKRNAVL